METSDQGNRAPDGRFVRTADTAERDAQAVRLRARGGSYAGIAQALGYANKGSAAKAVQRALADIVRPDVEELRALMSEELDLIQVEAWQVVRGKHLKVSNSGRVAVDPLTQEPLLDPVPKISAINTLVKVSARRASLFGLDAPTAVRVETPVDVNAAFDAEIVRLNALIEAEARPALLAEYLD